MSFAADLSLNDLLDDFQRRVATPGPDPVLREGVSIADFPPPPDLSQQPYPLGLSRYTNTGLNVPAMVRQDQRNHEEAYLFKSYYLSLFSRALEIERENEQLRSERAALPGSAPVLGERASIFSSFPMPENPEQQPNLLGSAQFRNGVFNAGDTMAQTLKDESDALRFKQNYRSLYIYALSIEQENAQLRNQSVVKMPSPPINVVPAQLRRQAAKMRPPAVRLEHALDCPRHPSKLRINAFTMRIVPDCPPFCPCFKGE
jgi:hypothetical protein